MKKMLFKFLNISEENLSDYVVLLKNSIKTSTSDKKTNFNTQIDLLEKDYKWFTYSHVYIYFVFV